MTLLKTIFTLIYCSVVYSADPSTRVVLPQGVLTGIKMQTERRVIVTGYLGIPYALPPIGPYRFAPPERHPGWNNSLVAEHFRPDCLQSRDESVESRTTSEDCLYLNVFVPEAGTLNDFPVVVFLEGKEYVTGSPRSVEAQELAAEGVIVVTFSYRLNVFGFLCLGDSNSRGNLGLLDQYLAFLWVRENTIHFGGRPEVTLMGHGAGATSIVAHMTSPRTRGLFERAIIMSGSVFSPTLHPDLAVTASKNVARSLGCLTEASAESTFVLNCLRQKSAEEVLRAFNNINQNANWTIQLTPVSDSFLPERMQYLPTSPTETLQSGKFMQIPIITGTSANEGTILLDRWNDLATQTEASVQQFINQTAIPYLLRARGYPSKHLSVLLEWYYLNNMSGPRLAQLIKLYTDAEFLAPHWQQVASLSASSQPIFVYRFSQKRTGDDLSAGGFGSELQFLFGPIRKDNVVPFLSLRQPQSGRNPMTFAEERLSLRMKRLWTTFMRTGDPNPANVNGSKIWPPYSKDTLAFLDLFGDPVTGRTMDLSTNNPDLPGVSLWNDLLPKLNKASNQITEEASLDVYIPKPGDCGPYRSAMFTTLFFLVLLIACLVLALVLLKRHLGGKQRTKL